VTNHLVQLDLIDIVLNFVTMRKPGENGQRDWKTVCVRYLMTWFVVDAISIIPWERYYIKPIVEI